MTLTSSEISNLNILKSGGGAGVLWRTDKERRFLIGLLEARAISKAAEIEYLRTQDKPTAPTSTGETSYSGGVRTTTTEEKIDVSLGERSITPSEFTIKGKEVTSTSMRYEEANPIIFPVKEATSRKLIEPKTFAGILSADVPYKSDFLATAPALFSPDISAREEVTFATDVASGFVSGVASVAVISHGLPAISSLLPSASNFLVGSTAGLLGVGAFTLGEAIGTRAYRDKTEGIGIRFSPEVFVNKRVEIGFIAGATAGGLSVVHSVAQTQKNILKDLNKVTYQSVSSRKVTSSDQGYDPSDFLYGWGSGKSRFSGGSNKFGGGGGGWFHKGGRVKTSFLVADAVKFATVPKLSIGNILGIASSRAIAPSLIPLLSNFNISGFGTKSATSEMQGTLTKRDLKSLTNTYNIASFSTGLKGRLGLGEIQTVGFLNLGKQAESISNMVDQAQTQTTKRRGANIYVPFMPIPPKISGFGWALPKKRSKKGKKGKKKKGRKLGYQAGFTSIAFNIRGAMPKKSLFTGFELRPKRRKKTKGRK